MLKQKEAANAAPVTPSLNTRDSLVSEISARLQEELLPQIRAENQQLLDTYRALRPLLSVKDVAHTLSISARTVETMIATGELPPALWIKGQRRWDPATIAAYLRSLSPSKSR